jgi:hypothetical protein
MRCASSSRRHTGLSFGCGTPSPKEYGQFVVHAGIYFDGHLLRMVQAPFLGRGALPHDFLKHFP